MKMFFVVATNEPTVTALSTASMYTSFEAAVFNARNMAEYTGQEYCVVQMLDVFTTSN